MTKLALGIIAVGLAAIAAMTFLHRRGEREGPTPQATAEASGPPEPAAPPAPRAPVAAPTHPVPAVWPSPPAQPGEASLMATLHGIGATDPARTLAIARKGNERFPGSADAPERAWMICQSLAALGRFPEAQDEARRMVSAYPDTSWAADVRRHLLTQSPDPPSRERPGLE
jgi:TolA-binding protein